MFFHQLDNKLSNALEEYKSGKYTSKNILRLMALKNSDWETIILCVEKCGLVLKFAPQYNDELVIVKKAVFQNPEALQYASPYMKGRTDVISLALKRYRHLESDTVSPICYASKEIRSDKQFMTKILIKDPELIKYGTEIVKNDYHIMLHVVKYDGRLLRYASDKMKKNKNIILTSVQNNGMSLEFANDVLKRDYEVIIVALINNPQSLKYTNMDVVELISNHVVSPNDCINYLLSHISKKRILAIADRYDSLVDVLVLRVRFIMHAFCDVRFFY